MKGPNIFNFLISDVSLPLFISIVSGTAVVVLVVVIYCTWRCWRTKRDQVRKGILYIIWEERGGARGNRWEKGFYISLWEERGGARGTRFVKDIDVCKSSCVHGINTMICKKIMVAFPQEISYIFRRSVITGIFPYEWSRGCITVIPKGGVMSDPSNWRPITQTSIFAKVFEKLIYRRIMSYFDDNQILSNYQYGFRPRRSTQQSIFDLLKFVYSSLNNKKLFAAICLDVCKAFDCINHDVLLFKLAKIGFSYTSLAWFKSYLNRTQTVRFNDTISKPLSCITGIGQGTILGPLIFIFYINDVVQAKGNLMLNMYADDCILFKSGNNWNLMCDSIQLDLDNINSWCVRNRLKLSAKFANMYLKIVLSVYISKLFCPSLIMEDLY